MPDPARNDSLAGEDVWDVVVVGAGPAGSAAALGALCSDPSLRVLLLDRADFPRDKSCGDGIAPHVAEALASVGAADVVEGWEPVRRLELAHRGSTVAREMARPAWVVPRKVFDARLVRHATGAGARLRRHRARRVEVGTDGVLVDGRVRGRVLVGADGAHSLVRSALGLPSGRRAIAIRGYTPVTSARRGSQVIVYGEGTSPSYAWSFDRGDGLANVGYGELLPDEGPGPSRQRMLEQLDRLLPGSVDNVDSTHATTDGGWKAHHLPLSQWRWRQPDGPALLAGDAAGLVNPMTGEGIYYAVASGILAGRAAATAVRRGEPARAGALHRRSVQRLLARHLRHTAVASRLSAVPAVVDAGVRAAARDQATFDTLVEIGLGQGLLTPRLLGRLTRQLARPSPAH